MKIGNIGYIVLPAVVGATIVGVGVYSIARLNENINALSQLSKPRVERAAEQSRAPEDITGLLEENSGVINKMMDQRRYEIEKMLQRYQMHPENGTPIPDYPGWYWFNPMPRFNPDISPPFKLIPPYRKGDAHAIPLRR